MLQRTYILCNAGWMDNHLLQARCASQTGLCSPLVTGSRIYRPLAIFQGKPRLTSCSLILGLHTFLSCALSQDGPKLYIALFLSVKYEWSAVSGPTENLCGCHESLRGVHKCWAKVELISWYIHLNHITLQSLCVMDYFPRAVEDWNNCWFPAYCKAMQGFLRNKKVLHTYLSNHRCHNGACGFLRCSTSK